MTMKAPAFKNTTMMRICLQIERLVMAGVGRPMKQSHKISKAEISQTYAGIFRRRLLLPSNQP